MYSIEAVENNFPMADVNNILADYYDLQLIKK